MLEVVSLSLADELRSISIGLDIGVDWILGGTHPEAALETVRGSGACYCPFAGTVSGHPSVLEGSIADIARHAGMVSKLDGVTGIDLLAYRHERADIAELTRAVVEATPGPVIGAGSVCSARQIETLASRRLGIHDRKCDLRWAATRGPRVEGAGSRGLETGLLYGLLSPSLMERPSERNSQRCRWAPSPRPLFERLPARY